jgi:hypothetical protein
MKYYALAPLSPVNARGTWLRGYEDLANWFSQGDRGTIGTPKPLPLFEFGVANKKSLKDCIAISGFGLLFSEKAWRIIQNMTLPEHSARPMTILSKDQAHIYYWIEVAVLENVLNLKKTPFWNNKTQSAEYVSDLQQGRKIGSPMIETGIYLRKHALQNYDLFTFYANTPFRWFVSEKFVTIVQEKQLTGLNCQIAEWLTVE